MERNLVYDGINLLFIWFINIYFNFIVKLE